MPFDHDALPYAEDVVHDERSARPLRNLVLVRRIVERETAGGIIIPRVWKRRHPAQKHSAQAEYWRARVVAVGPEVRELEPGDEVLVHTWAEVGEGLYTGTRLPGHGTLVRYPEDLVCAVTPDPVGEPDPFPEPRSPYRGAA